MADRKASVALELQAGQFKAEARTVESAVRGVDREVDKLDRDITKIPPDAAKAAAAMKLLDGDIRGVGTQVGNIGDKSVALSLLDTRIKSSRAEVKKLAAEFEKTGDVEIFKKLGKAQGDLAALTRIRKELAKAMGDGGKDGASTFASFFQGGIIDAFKSLPPQLKAAVAEALVVSIIAAAAPIGAAINGVMLAGIGLGGIGLGIAGQFKNPAVQAAFGQLGKDLSGTLTAVTGGFTGPLVGAAKILDKSLTGTLIKLGGAFDDLAGHVEPLARGIAEMVEQLAPGLADAFKAAGPILDQLATKNLPELGQAFDRFFALMADGSDGASKGLDLIFLAVETLIVGVGGLIDGFSHLYNWFLAPGEKILDWWDRLDQKQTGVAHRLDTVGPAAEGAAGKVATAAETMSEKFKDLDSDISAIGTAFSHVGKSVETEFTNKVLDQMLAFDDATIAWESSLAKLDDTAKKNGTSLDALNEKTGKYNDKALDNEKALLALVKANAQVYQQNLLSGMSADQAAAAYKHNSEVLRQQAIDAGFNAKEVDNLIGKYGDVPNEVKTILATQGLTEALNHLGGILTDFRLLDDKQFQTKYFVDTYYRDHGGSYGGGEAAKHQLPPGHHALGGIRHAAAGMIVAPSDPGVLMAEPQTGGEALIPLRGITQSRAMDLARTVGSNYGFSVSPWHGGGTTRVVYELQVTGRGELSQLLQGMVRKQQLQLVAK